MMAEQISLALNTMILVSPVLAASAILFLLAAGVICDGSTVSLEEREGQQIFPQVLRSS